MIAIYSSFAYFYDRLVDDIDYARWADYIEKIFSRFGISPELVLDLGCGTGSFCMEMCARGYDMTGIDISSDMLSCAKAKSLAKGMDILYLNQDMAGFELYGTVDAAVCLLDSINHITSKNDMKHFLKLVNNYLNPDGLFVFDINSRYKFENILAGNVFYEISDDIAYIWKNDYDRKKRICLFDLTFFVRNGDLYKRYDDEHSERDYSVNEMKQLISSSGLELCTIFDEFEFDPPGKTSERIFFVCRKCV